jgi:hypothetical protein
MAYTPTGSLALSIAAVNINVTPTRRVAVSFSVFMDSSFLNGLWHLLAD